MDLEKFNVKGKEYIYLVMVEYRDKTLLKIGYTKTVDERMDAYELHNPDIQLLKIREGTRDLEGYMHKKFEKYAYPKRREWFFYNEEIIKGFDTLEEMNFLDIDKLKNKIYNLLKPRPVEELKRIYYEKFKKEIENEGIDKNDLDILITNTFFFLNDNIENFILSFDFSGIPLELDPNTHYQVSIPNPISFVDISINLEQILGRQLDENPWKNSDLVCIKCTNLKHKTTKEEFEEFINEKLKRSSILLSGYDKCDDREKFEIAKKYQSDAKISHYCDDYIYVSEVNTNQLIELVPTFNESVKISEIRAFEIFQEDYKNKLIGLSIVDVI